MLKSVFRSIIIVGFILVLATIFFTYYRSHAPTRIRQTPAALITTKLHRKISHNTRPPFEPDGIDCVVNRLDTPSEVKRYLQVPPEKPCSLSYFHEYFKANGQFYGKGAWDARTVEYLPADCTFSNYTGNKSSFSQCLDYNNISRILVTGDSTARLLSTSLIGLFNDMSCNEVRSNSIKGTGSGGNVTDDKKYFLTPKIAENLFYSASERGVALGDRHSVSRTFRCTSRTGRTVYIEYIATTRLLHDLGIMIKKHSLRETGSRFDASNKLEYLLRYYFPYRGFPDLWLFKPPFRHEVWWSSVEKIDLDIAYTIKLLGRHLPARSRLVFLTDSRECTKMLPYYISEQWKKKSALELRNGKLHLYNQLFYEAFHELSYRFPNMYAFLDDMRLSCPMVCDFNRDGGHYVKAYYTSLSRYLFESICSVS